MVSSYIYSHSGKLQKSSTYIYKVPDIDLAILGATEYMCVTTADTAVQLVVCVLVTYIPVTRQDEKFKLIAFEEIYLKFAQTPNETSVGI